ncbi:hypothetical protein QNI19_35720 [Cytophagaceae bacterium DM2B3-1]|uniref:Knr4/Smi1-like domain-containing protein n=1 Tax=Xanthocytophaga flava TaxID=3048013 RepID=A0ABT7CX87_9BACT|nr:hypothetical protein [Xanthocytophaga flavus]MDJ1498338.1 hypothetical protein [Xanthocytophaga flavus]
MSETQTFKRLYVKTNSICLELDQKIPKKSVAVGMIGEIIQNIDTLLTMLSSLSYVKIDERNNGLPINLNDAEDIPSPPYAKEIYILYQSNAQIVLEDWKFRIWKTILDKYPDDLRYRKLYLEALLTQAEKCVDIFSSLGEQVWIEWQKDMLSQQANTVGWLSYLYISDKDRLEHALMVLEKGYVVAGFTHLDWDNRKYIHDTKARLLLKLNREDEAYAIIYQTLTAHPEHTDFDDLKETEPYLQWIQKKKQQEKAAIKKAKDDKKAFEQLVKEEQTKVVNQFLNPAHPLVVQHTDVLNLIKQRMVAVRLRKQYYESGWEKMRNQVDSASETDYSLKPWSEKQIATYQTKHEIQLPDELKVYLMEIGEGGGSYFCWGNPIVMEKKKNAIQILKTPFPITADKIHDINHYWKIKAWVMLDYYFEGEEDEGDGVEELIKYLKRKKILHRGNTLQELFAIDGSHELGCLFLGYSDSQDGLYLVMNGEFEGEVWVDTLQYSIEEGGCFGAATPERRKFLSFIAGSLLANAEGYANASEEGAWL